MKRLIAAILLVGCASQGAFKPTAPYSALPEIVDLDKMLPPPLPRVEVSGSAFPTQALPGGEYCPRKIDDSQCFFVLQGGFLISEQTYARAANAVLDAMRFEAESRALYDLRQRELATIREAEKAYQAHIAALEKDVYELGQPTFWDKAKPWVAFGAGVLLTTGIVWGVNRAR